MIHPAQTSLRAVANPLGKALVCLAPLFIFAPRAQADTLNVVGSGGPPSPPGSVDFIGRSFNWSFNVTSAGQTFDFVFGRYSLSSGGCLRRARARVSQTRLSASPRRSGAFTVDA